MRPAFAELTVRCLMENKLRAYKQNRILALVSIFSTVLLAFALSLNYKFHFFVQLPAVIAFIVSASIYAYAAWKYRCPFCGKHPECEEGLVIYGAESCQSCGHALL